MKKYFTNTVFKTGQIFCKHKPRGYSLMQSYINVLCLLTQKKCGYPWFLDISLVGTSEWAPRRSINGPFMPLSPNYATYAMATPHCRTLCSFLLYLWHTDRWTQQTGISCSSSNFITPFNWHLTVSKIIWIGLI